MCKRKERITSWGLTLQWLQYYYLCEGEAWGSLWKVTFESNYIHYFASGGGNSGSSYMPLKICLHVLGCQSLFYMLL